MRNSEHQTLKYRSDIDGLRAIAVISVLLYHFDIKPFTGGFIGVDVFFVISGFLITGGILKLADAGRFCFKEFYDRRARRLFPALLITVIASYIIAFMVFSPIDFAKMSGSAIFALTAMSNIFFWLESNYFDTSSIVKPLLHTWSLSVELQFYLIWPLMIYFLQKKGKKILLAGIILSIIVGLLISIVEVKRDNTAAFYLTQFRFHEFASGGLAAFANRHLKFEHSKRTSNTLFALGLALILLPIFTFNTHTTFPGINAMIPVCGSVLVIYFGDKTFLSHFLSIGPIRYTGKISYSLYLIHWPLIVFVQYILFRKTTFLETFGLFLLTYILSAMMCRFIEKPLMNTKKIKLKPSIFSLACAIVATLVILPASNSWINRGWVWRLPEKIRSINDFDIKSYENYVWDEQVKLTRKKDFQFNGKKRLLIIGDSQSADIINIMNESGEMNKFDVIARTVSYECGSPYIIKSDRSHFFKNENPITIKSPQIIETCSQQMDNVLNLKLFSSAEVIFIAMKWEYHSLPRIQDSINIIEKNTNASIILFGNKNLNKSSIDIVNTLGRTIGIEEYAYRLRSPSVDEINQILSNTRGVYFINMLDLVCKKKGQCSVLDYNMKPIFFDPSHLTRYGAIYLGSAFEQVLNNKISY